MLPSENRKTIKCIMYIGSALALALLVLYSFYPALDNSFVSWDDQFYVTLNPFIANPTWNSFVELWRVIVSLNYHPLTMSSLWLNSYWSGIDSASPFIITNLVFHFCNATLVFILMTKLFPKALMMAIFVTLIFAIHPMHVESVVWVSERKDVLYVFFFLASLLSYISFVDNAEKFYYFLSLVLFMFSGLSKAMAVSLVPVLFIIDFVKYRYFNFQNSINKFPFLIVGLLFGSIALDIQSGGEGFGFLNVIASEKAMNVNVKVPFWERLSYGSYGLIFYMVKFVWPFELSAFHPYDGIADGQFFLIYPIVLAVILVILISSFCQNREMFFGISFFIFTIFLVLQFLPVGAALVAERYSYLPYIGLAIVLGFGLQYFYDRYSKIVVIVLLLLVTISMSYLTRKQSNVWQDQVSLFSQVVDLYPDNVSARHYLATGFWQQGEYGHAIRHLNYAIDTLYGITDQNFELLANSYSELGDTIKAVAYYNKSIELNPSNLIARYHRSLLLVDSDPLLAIEDLTLCEQSNNAYVNQFIYSPRGRAYGILGQYDLAISDFQKAIELNPEDIWNYYDLGLTYEFNMEFEKAFEAYEKGLMLDPNFELISDRIMAIHKTLQ